MNFDMTILENMCLPTVAIFCVILGIILKKWIADKNNKFIPTILTIVGAVLGCVINREITVESIIQGAFSGLASTGMHQMFKQVIKEKNSDKTGE